MANPNDLEVFEWLLSFAGVGVFCAGFGMPSWVLTDTRKYGLWNNCTTNSTESEEEGEDECIAIKPGESARYFEGLRIASCVGLVFYVFVLFSLFRDRNKKQCGGYLRAFLALLGAVTTAGVVGVFMENYESDPGWSEESPRISTSLWLMVAAAGVGLIMFIILCRRGGLEKQEAARQYGEELERIKKEREKKAREERERREQEQAEAREQRERENRATGGAQGAGARTKPMTPAATLKKKLQNNRVVPSTPARPASGRGAGSRPASVHFASESTSVSISSESDTGSEDSLPLPVYYTEESGRVESPSLPRQTPLPFLTVPEPRGPPPSYDEVMINPEFYPGYFQPPYEDSVDVMDQGGFSPPPRPATADSVAAGRRAGRF